MGVCSAGSRRLTAVALIGALGGLAGCGGSTGSSGPFRQPNRQAVPALGSLASSGAGHRFYEIYDPAGSARGTMLVLHGGSWKDQRGDARRMMMVASLAFRARGWRVVDVSYTPGYQPGRGADPAPMLRDVVAFYDQIRRAFGGPICAYGESAGGHLAAMLALERPTLTCAILNAAPLDLPKLLHSTLPALVPLIKRTFGTSASLLDQWSPAVMWNPRIDRTAVFATAASNDLVVPAAQLEAFARSDPSADVAVLPGASPGTATAVPWMHSAVRGNAIDERLAQLDRWLDRIAPPRGSVRSAPAGIGAACQMSARPGNRWQLLLAGDAWRQSSTPGEPIAATRGCSGSAHWQDDGLSLWALPSPTGALGAGAQASITLSSGQVVHRVSVSFRGFLARPTNWTIGLYASRGRGAPVTTVAACRRGRCSGLRLVSTGAGELIAAAGSRGNPDDRDQPADAQFTVPQGTQELTWQLRCDAPSGCSLAPAATVGGASVRSRDPLGQPAIFSLYRIAVS